MKASDLPQGVCVCLSGSTDHVKEQTRLKQAEVCLIIIILSQMEKISSAHVSGGWREEEEEEEGGVRRRRMEGCSGRKMCRL